jgi:superfamily I DNA/RNA helicase
VALIASRSRHDALVDALIDLEAVAGSIEALDAPVAVLTPLTAKGLEFDHVIVVEPAELVGSDAAGLRMLYVSLTRATRDLVIVHAEPLPEVLLPVPVQQAAS